MLSAERETQARQGREQRPQTRTVQAHGRLKGVIVPPSLPTHMLILYIFPIYPKVFHIIDMKTMSIILIMILSIVKGMAFRF